MWPPASPPVDDSSTRHAIPEKGAPLGQCHLLLERLIAAVGALLFQRGAPLAHSLACGRVGNGAIGLYAGRRRCQCGRCALGKKLSRCYAKANPGKVSFASAGIGSSQHVSGELFKMMAGVDMVHV